MMDPYIDRYLHEYEQEERREQAAAIVDWWLMDARLDYYLDPDSYPRNMTPDYYAVADMDDEDLYDRLETAQKRANNE